VSACETEVGEDIYVELPPHPTIEVDLEPSSRDGHVKPRTIAAAGCQRRAVDQAVAAETLVTYNRVSDVHLDQQHLGVATVFDARDGVVEAVTLVDAELYREVLVVWELVGEDATVRVVPDDVVSESEPCREMETYT
jgi:hypothetical protein